MIDLVLVKFLRDCTPYKAGTTAAFSPTVAENFRKRKVVDVVGPVKRNNKEVVEPVMANGDSLSKPARVKLGTK